MLKADSVGSVPITIWIGEGLWKVGSARLDLMFGGMLSMLVLIGSFEMMERMEI